MGIQREKLCVWRGFFMGPIMGDEISAHSSASIKKVVRYYGFPLIQEHEYYGFLIFFIFLNIP
jgi:tripartite-type tricarboxylate transporter receptor subunit TctC